MKCSHITSTTPTLALGEGERERGRVDRVLGTPSVVNMELYFLIGIVVGLLATAQAQQAWSEYKGSLIKLLIIVT